MRLLALLTALLMVTASGASAAECAQYEPVKETVSGSVFARVDPEPQALDGRATHYYLKLDKTLCVQEGKSDPDLDPAETEIRVMQRIYFVNEPWLQAWLGKHVIVTGTLMHQNTVHHLTKVLIIPERTRVSDERAP